ncbi:ATP-binding cassette domain-containing protein [Actinomadura barringtoniae]|uniref:ATP-binding cassette domain-containing protein n=1 Tax=Actinomadura barringtoniae TaxID=1427535 RepID=A0A939PLH6_9ACTN|nr:ATP-binding cassette domain-containing protein [Actinomadura barringtoniae]MBO2454532.1 ATP-binding cassette domain-containing protein [Actinomadura barringtoniae]
MEADGVGVRTYRGWVYSGVTLQAGRGAVVAVAGPGGSGRTSFLLTVAGRMKPSVGSLSVCGLALPRAAAKVRARVAVARATGAAELEPELRVGDHVRERRLTLSRSARKHADKTFGQACELVGLEPAAKELVGELEPADATRLALALALMERPEVVLLDDLDEGADGAAQQDLWAAVRRTADTGVTVLASTTEPSPADGMADVFVALGDR